MFYYGADYYPEHWPETRWQEDARLMQEAGFNVVRLAEFAWIKMEPRPGEYDFDWLDRAIDLLAAHGIKTVLGTPTASPPPWMMIDHPDRFIVNEQGVRAIYGGRREYCPTNAAYRDHSVQITQAMADHYKDNPHVIGWQIDNEFGDRCYCPVCQQGFQQWLQQRYGTLDELNDRWGTIFWSHVYTDWSQIPMPLKTAGGVNPGLDLDYRRFMSDTYVAYQQLQVDILRQTCPQHFVTHNFMGFKYDGLDYFDLAQPLDRVTWDNYPRGFWDIKPEPDPAQIALSHDAMRGLKHQPFWVMEAQSGLSGWEFMGIAPRPGEIRLWAYQAIAHGADGIVFFRWRTARFGTEEYWHGILDHDGRPRRRYAEVRQMGEEITRIGDRLINTSLRPEVALLTCYDTRFAFQIQPNNPHFHYPTHIADYHAALHDHNIPVEVVSPEDDFSNFALVIAPALYIVDEALAQKLQTYVEKGGTVLFTARSGVKDIANAVVDKPLPGLLAGICGVEVEEYDLLDAETANPLRFSQPEYEKFNNNCAAHLWCDVLEPQTAEAVAFYTTDYYAGKPAITLNHFGKGQVIYVGTLGDGGLAKAAVDFALSQVNVHTSIASPAGVEVVTRWQDDRRLLLILNHSRETQQVALDQDYRDLLDGTLKSGAIAIAPKDVIILSEG